MPFYSTPEMRQWTGRVDGTAETQRRWHQHVKPFNLAYPLEKSLKGSVVLLGFACDEGVKRNQGRAGAAKGPAALRNALCNLPVFHPQSAIYDAGDILCPDGDLETAQQQLAVAVKQVHQHGAFPLLLGGGHEIAYGHYRGIADALQNDTHIPRIGIVNFDAHFDNREPEGSGPNSGTGFWQIANDCKKKDLPFHYLALGIQKASNTPHLFDTAHLSGTQYALATHLDGNFKHIPQRLITAFSEAVDWMVITVDLDVFAAAYAPGVSAPAYNGILPNAAFFEHLDSLFNSGKVLSLDVAELNPDYDTDGRTAKLAASIIFHAVERLAGRSR